MTNRLGQAALLAAGVILWCVGDTHAQGRQGGGCGMSRNTTGNRGGGLRQMPPPRG
jgi:hypothetical protein